MRQVKNIGKMLIKGKDYLKKENKLKVTVTGQSDLEGFLDYDQDEVIDTLIRMTNHIKITRINRELQGQYVTLCHINRLVAQEYVEAWAVRQYLITKSGEAQKVRERSGSQGNALHGTQYYVQYSNGLIFQYYSVRALLWKVGLGYLPASKKKWISTMEGNLIKYLHSIREHLAETVHRKNNRKSSAEIKFEESEQKKTDLEGRRVVEDHPLNRKKESKWKSFFDDIQLWHIIEKDTIRTKPRCVFFREPFSIELGGDYQDTLAATEYHLSKDSRKQTFYYDAVTRVIYIFLKAHPGTKYCQGMNEIAALLFYSFANKNSEYFRRVAESDTYFCFERVVVALTNGTNSFLAAQKWGNRLEELLKRVDLRLYQILQQNAYLNNLKILSVKWFSSYYLNEFQIDDSLILWDGVISLIGTEGDELRGMTLPILLMAIALAIVHLSRNELADGQNPLTLLNRIPHRPEPILDKALSLYRIFTPFFE